jgi:hypothetical protein
VPPGIPIGTHLKLYSIRANHVCAIVPHTPLIGFNLAHEAAYYMLSQADDQEPPVSDRRVVRAHRSKTGG